LPSRENESLSKYIFLSQSGTIGVTALGWSAMSLMQEFAPQSKIDMFHPDFGMTIKVRPSGEKCSDTNPKFGKYLVVEADSWS